MDQIARYTTKVDVTFTGSTSTTGGFTFSNYAGALICATGTGDLTFYVKPNENSSTLRPITKADGSAITVAVNNSAVPLPDECYAGNYIVATTSGPNITCTILLKG